MAERTVRDALQDLIPLAHRWATNGGDNGGGNSGGLRALADAADAGLGAPALPVLQSFSLRLGARRRVDAATALAGWPAVAAVLDRQARTLGRAQLAAVRDDGAELARAFRRAADQHEEMVDCLAGAL